ncbi:MAG: phospholipase A [Gallionella sp.]|nr:phospholipase A [Gallionella sp.]
MRITLRNYRNTILLSGTLLSVAFCAALAPSAYAGSDDFLPCAQKFPGDDAGRLKCFDQLAAPIPAPQENIVPDEDAEASAAPAAVPTRGAGRSYLTRAWNLDDLPNPDPSKLGRIQPYRQTYLLAKRSSKPNRQPSSPAIGHSTLAPNDVDTVETKFQLSFKADIGNQHNIDFLGITSLRFWGAYTQQSHWQVINFRNSSAFRETIYEPELIATLGTGYASGLKLINFGWLHQSNGRLLPESRSWNRVYLLGGWEWNNTTSILVRGWRRLAEKPLEDDNPDIGDYLGRGDLVIRWEPGDKSQSVAMLLRNNLSSTHNRGYVQIDWATPVKLGDAARVHIQMTSGYGESLIDYNHRQNSISLGLSFREW